MVGDGAAPAHTRDPQDRSRGQVSPRRPVGMSLPDHSACRSQSRPKTESPIRDFVRSCCAMTGQWARLVLGPRMVWVAASLSQRDLLLGPARSRLGERGIADQREASLRRAERSRTSDLIRCAHVARTIVRREARAVDSGRVGVGICRANAFRRGKVRHAQGRSPRAKRISISSRRGQLGYGLDQVVGSPGAQDPCSLADQAGSLARRQLTPARLPPDQRRSPSVSRLRSRFQH